MILARELFNELLEWCELSALYQVELLDEVDEMFEGGVEVSLLAQLHHLLEVLVVDVCVHPEQPLQYRFGNG